MGLTERMWPVLSQLMKGHALAYRATGGLIGHRFPGAPPTLLLDHVGAKSGTKRTSPLTYIPDGDNLVIVASKGGNPRHPAWFHNLRANPDVTIQVRDEGAGRCTPRRRDPEGANAAVAEGLGDLPRLRGIPAPDRSRDPAGDPRAAGRAPAFARARGLVVARRPATPERLRARLADPHSQPPPGASGPRGAARALSASATVGDGVVDEPLGAGRGNTGRDRLRTGRSTSTVSARRSRRAQLLARP